MLLKAGVDISRLKPCIRKKLTMIEHICTLWNFDMVITSTYGGDHSAGSIHYANEAVDIAPPEKNVQGVVIEIKHKLGNDYDVVNEFSHIHIEYDPK